jgi:hypothetical protein
MTLTIKDIIADTDLFQDDDIIYALRIDGKFLKDSQVAILDLTEEEKNMSIAETIETKCPGFDYFIEARILNDLMYDLESEKPPLDLDKMIESIFHYVEFNE